MNTRTPLTRRLAVLLSAALLTLALPLAQAQPQTSPPQPGTKTLNVELPGEGGAITLIWCPPGTFVMGSPENETGHRADETRHTVTLRGFWIAETETTQAQWQSLRNITMEQWLKREPNRFCTPAGFGPGHPVYAITYWEAMDFCKRLTEHARKAGAIPKGYVFRLPSEAQWEYACRAGSTAALPSGQELSDWLNCPNLHDIAWYRAKRPNETRTPGTQKVAQKKPNAWGLYDMLGNVAEWCLDNADFDYDHELVVTKTYVDGLTDPVSRQGQDRIYRGGSWDFPVTLCRSAARRCQPPKTRGSHVGFRLALVPAN